MTANYYSVECISQHEIEPIKKSRFIAHLLPLKETSELHSFLQKLTKEYANANHHCWAYHLFDNQQMRFNDDGEPSGSAGKPILNHLQGNKLINAAIVVTRIFGGTKLGVGGLVRAYGQAASEVIKNSQLVSFTPSKRLSLTYQYRDTALIEQVLHTLQLTPIDSIFGNDITLHFDIALTHWDTTYQTLLEMTQGRVIIHR
ncbi:YigZ family protein [Cysteiniphilum sp. QT6929]|uniref:YigZ family protein n=1 Tax=Cysteiniphilum sp. QT6929 TaxID=2975055 RepID=UPI0024B36024|nr:YigZ family protein [Cysteiniphilum sp. QT6929]WHN66170.1 YigZ family protein [Cysteiniphilum sp. QT6929]